MESIFHKEKKSFALLTKKRKLNRLLPSLLKIEKSYPIGCGLMFQRNPAENRRPHRVSTNPAPMKKQQKKIHTKINVEIKLKIDR